MKYIGPFLRINTMDINNIEKQLLYFSRESFKHILFNSRCGVTSNLQQLKLKNLPNLDSNIFRKISPLLCIYKKANPKLNVAKDSLTWDEDTFKKEVNVSSNIFMNLMLMDLSNYYHQFENLDANLYALSKIYSQLAIKQLDFFSSYLRSADGVFVDKKDCSEDEEHLDFVDKEKKFKFSDQALCMAAYYKVSNLPDNADAEAYKSFSLDILNMLISYKDQLYDLSLEEINRLCLAFNVFYEENKNEEAKYMLMDLYDLLIDRTSESLEENSNIKIDNLCMAYINLDCAHDSLGLLKFEEERDKILQILNSYYDTEKGIFIKNTEKKDVDFSSQEVVLYTLCQLINLKNHADSGTSIITDVYKRQLINSGLILSWPDTPSLDSPERYRNFTNKSEDLLEDDYFRMPSIPTPESSQLAPIFIKNISYNKKKDAFEQSKNTFDSSKNMPLLYLIQYTLNRKGA
ncbi:hypothetical protein [Clostridium thermarum]|uniref:hypothetical protein n=1 Tax=Clostridium thermarum TaxID=1716543 RepID=UPI00111E9C1E|nr:hypothetical protein [Clostridium thermarum]